jgi:hypothetical protein
MCLLPGLFEFLLAAMETGDSAQIQQNASWTLKCLALQPQRTKINEMYECAGLVEALERKAKVGDFPALQTIHSLTSNQAVTEDIRANRASLVAVLQANSKNMFAKLALVNIFGVVTGATELCVDETLVRFVTGTLLDGIIEGTCVWKLHLPLCAIRNLVAVDANAKLVLDQPNIIERLVCAADLGQRRGEPDAVYLACMALCFLAFNDQVSAELKLKLFELRAMETDIDAKPQDVWGDAAREIKALIWQLTGREDMIAKNAPAVVRPVAPRSPMPTDPSAIRAYFSHATTDGDSIADELLAQGWKNGEALTALWMKRADLKTQLPGLNLGQLRQAKVALGALFG